MSPKTVSMFKPRSEIGVAVAGAGVTVTVAVWVAVGVGVGVAAEVGLVELALSAVTRTTPTHVATAR